MIYKYLLLLIFTTSLFSKTFTVASYNVENLFDLNYDRTEYKEYIPNTHFKWNQKNYIIKLNNISKVIKDLNADIILAQEIESKQAFNDLLKLLPQYSYSFFYKNKKAPIGLAIFSKYKITNNEVIKIAFSKINRPIIKSTLQIENKYITIFNNHWPSKRNKESTRVQFALTLENEIKKLTKEQDYIIVGDLNSNYNEYETFKYDKKLNNTQNFTAINDVLLTKVKKENITKQKMLDYKKRVHYNLWLELSYKERFSYIFRGNNSTPDNILLASSLFDNKNISYVNRSFKVYKPKYLFQNRKINRWEKNKKIHKGEGFSDHLPIIASFSTTSYIKEKRNPLLTIKSLYKNYEINYPIQIKNAIVIYKTAKIAILKQKNNRAIYVYKDVNKLKLGHIYDVEIHKIDEYHGLKEVTKLTVKKEKNYYQNYQELYLDSNKLNILDLQYQNEVITKLKGMYKKGYLHFKNKKIRLYAKDKRLLPNNGEKITIIRAHLGYFRNKPQIVIYNKNDIKVSP